MDRSGQEGHQSIQRSQRKCEIPFHSGEVVYSLESYKFGKLLSFFCVDIDGQVGQR